MNSPIFQTHCLSFKREPTIRAHVAALLDLRGPHTILWAIAEAIIYPLNAVFRTGPRSHVTIERFKTIFPLLAHRDPPTAVAMVIARTSAIASRLYRAPYFIFAGFARVMRSLSPKLQALPANTATTLMKFCVINRGPIPAIAETSPHRSVLPGPDNRAREGFNRKLPEFTSRDINEARHMAQVYHGIGRVAGIREPTI